MIGFDAAKAEVIARLGNRTDIDARVERWINYAYFELLLNPRFSFYELDKVATFNTVIGQASYTLTTIAPDFWIILDLLDLTNIRKLARAHYEWIDRIVPTQAQPTRYFHFNGSITLDPIPDGVYNTQLRYRFRPSDLVGGTGATFDGLGTEWEETILVMSTIKGFEALDQREKATVQRQILEALMTTRQDTSTLEDADAETTISPTLRNYYY